MFFCLVGVTHLSLQPAEGKNSVPFRLPQEQALFVCLSDAVSNGELKSAAGLVELGCEVACVAAVSCGTWLLFLIRLCPAKQSLDPLHGGSSNAHLPASRRAREDMCSHPAGVQPESSGESARG